ncbi:MAG: hypothetical protein AB8C13_05425 [Phycisphaerales bacterium]
MSLDRTLERLSPDDPAQYGLVAERLMLLGDPANHKLAQELLVRAIFWGVQNDEVHSASSACVALAGLGLKSITPAWLWDLAYLLDPARESEWEAFYASQSAGLDETTSLAVSCVYAVRYNDQPNGEELFAQPIIRERILSAAETAGVSRDSFRDLMLQQIQRGFDDPCRGRLYIADRENPGTRIACPDHRRGLGLLGNDQELRQFLRVELVLLGNETTTWGAASEMAMDDGVVMPSVRSLVRLLGAEPLKAYYRDGQWVSRP